MVLIWCAIFGALLTPKIMANELPNPGEPFNVAGVFLSTNAILAHFKSSGVPAEIKQAQTKSEAYCFVLAFPYSGANTVDLYCFIHRADRWLLFLKASLWNTRPGTVEFESDGDFMNVLREGKAILKLNAPKG
jgi:hypothetical protein